MVDTTLASDSRYYFVVALQFMSQNRTFNPHYAYRYRNEKAISLVVSNLKITILWAIGCKNMDIGCSRICFFRRLTHILKSEHHTTFRYHYQAIGFSRTYMNPIKL
jgi:hypothetical protein